MADLFGADLFGLFGTYLRESTLFALLHLAFIALIGVSARGIRNERRYLERFEDGDTPEGSLAHVLRQFRHEAIRLGKAGFVLPLTDYTDRLDARTEEILGQLRDWVGALLIIGIVGTMFGVYEFAAGAVERFQAAGDNSGTEVISSLALLLAESMEAAFPVGVVGLLLTVIFTIVANYLAGQLQGALSSATQRAMDARAEHAVSPAEQLAVAAREVREAVAPLRDLRETLTETLEPVVTSFGDRMDAALVGITDHLGHLDEVSRGLGEAAAGLATGVRELGEQTADFKRLVEEAPKVVEAVATIQRRAATEFDAVRSELARVVRAAGAVQQAVDATVDRLDDVPDRLSLIVEGAARDLSTRVDPLLATLDDAADRLRQAPAELQSQIQPVLETFGAQALQAWRDASDGLSRTAYNEYQRFLTETEAAVVETSSALTKAADDLTRLATTWNDRVLPTLQETVGTALLEKYPEALERIGEVGEAIDKASRVAAASAEPYRENGAAISGLTSEVGRLRSALSDRGPWVDGAGGHPLAGAIGSIERDIADVKRAVSNGRPRKPWRSRLASLFGK